MKRKSMMILHILNDGPAVLSDKVIAVQAEKSVVKVIDFTRKSVSYENIVDEIFFYDRVIPW